MHYYAFNPDNEYYFDEGCFIIEMLNEPDDQDVSIARARVLVGSETRLHALQNTTERYVILEGTGKVTIGGQTQVVNQGDVVTIASSQSQKIHNIGKQDLVFLAVCTPRFEIENYQDIDPKPLKST